MEPVILTYELTEIVVIIAQLFSVAIYDLGYIVACVVGIRVGRSRVIVDLARVGLDEACLLSFHSPRRILFLFSQVLAGGTLASVLKW